jgi:hypothetical protein
MPEQALPGERRSSGKENDRPATTRRLGLWVVLAALAAGAGSAAVIGLFPRSPPENVSRLVVIEKQGVDPSQPEPSLPTAARSEPAPEASASPASAETARPPAGSASARSGSPHTSENKGALLARAFQKQEGKIQSCFQQHGAGAETPSLSVRFQIDASGAVQNALVSPSSVAGTPLGQCITALARGTNFGPQSGPVSFSIPIAARVVRR